MISSISRRVRLVLHQPDEEAAPAAPGTDDLAEVEFVAYAEDGRLSGRIRLDSSRLTDMLNENDEYLLEGVLAERLPDGETMVIPEFLVRRHELLLVHATGPRGDRSRRTRTQVRAITLRSGPYLVTGDVHTAAGLDPLLYFRRRRPMVPLTDATVEYRTAHGPVQEYVGSIVVNRDLMDWVRAIDEGDAIAAHAGGAPARIGRPTT
ncbi:MAG: hypothetical protein HW391_294 [Chloroflexi bacterium]|nr:hypothetical protein [Chloroflexota bacterium]